jgi:prevent-host-death family protein
MQTITLEEAQNHLAEIIDKLAPGEEVILTRANRPVARILAGPEQPPFPVPGRGKGKRRCGRLRLVIRQESDCRHHSLLPDARICCPLTSSAITAAQAEAPTYCAITYSNLQRRSSGPWTYF